jgi:copper oxidase (laccase) domain-containing protein
MLIDKVPVGVISAKQVHSNNIVDAKDAVANETEADGLFLSDRLISAAIHTADCMPLVLTTKNSALVLHVSRKSLIKGLLDEVPNFISPKEIIGVYLGPHICADHFTFDEAGDEIKKFQTMFPEAVEVKENIYHLSLKNAVSKYFKEWAIEHIELQEDLRCTFKEESLPSYKRWMGTTTPLGRIVTIVSGI